MAKLSVLAIKVAKFASERNGKSGFLTSLRYIIHRCILFTHYLVGSINERRRDGINYDLVRGLRRDLLSALIFRALGMYCSRDVKAWGEFKKSGTSEYSFLSGEDFFKLLK